MGVVIILIIILIFFLSILIQNYNNYVDKKYQETKKININDIHAGDIIGFCCDYLNFHNHIPLYILLNIGQYLIFRNCICNHYGYVVELNGKKYICHMSPEIKFDKFTKKVIKESPVMESLQKKLISYPGIIFVFKNNIFNNSNINTLSIKYFENNKNKILNVNFLKWMIDVNFKMNILKTSKITCYDYVYDLLCDIHSIPKNKTWATSNIDIYNILQNYNYNEYIMDNYYTKKIRYP